MQHSSIDGKTIGDGESVFEVWAAKMSGGISPHEFLALPLPSQMSALQLFHVCLTTHYERNVFDVLLDGVKHVAFVGNLKLWSREWKKQHHDQYCCNKRCEGRWWSYLGCLEAAGKVWIRTDLLSRCWTWVECYLSQSWCGLSCSATTTLTT